MGQEGRLHQDTRHVGPDEHVERAALHAEVGDAAVARAEMADEAALHGGGEGDRLLHLGRLHQIAHDVAQVGPAARGHREAEPVLHRRETDGAAVVGVVEVVGLDPVEPRARARVGVDGDEEIRALGVRARGAGGEREGRVGAAGEHDLGAELLAEQQRDALRDGERDVLLDGVALGAGVVPAVARVEDDLGARGKGGGAGGRGRRGGRPALGNRSEHEREPAPVAADAVGRRRLEVEHHADLAVLAHADPRAADRRRCRHGAERPATEASPVRQVDVHPRRGPVRSSDVAHRRAHRGREQQDRGRAALRRRHLQAPQLGRITGHRHQGEARPERHGPPPPPPRHGRQG